MTEIRYKAIGDFLKTRRAKVTPEMVGLPATGRRRTPGLRREEVAALAGVSVTWYTWLEQGREIQVSNQVVESLARVLKLDSEEIAYLHDLTLTIDDNPVRKETPNTVSPFIQHMIDGMEYAPAIVLDKYYNVIAWNRAELMLYGTVLSNGDQAKWNLIDGMFSNTDFQNTFGEWEDIAHLMVARFRRNFGRNIDDPKFKKLIDDLSSKYSKFVEQWNTNDVMADESHAKVIVHPNGGNLQFEETCVLVADSPELKIYIYTPVMDSDTLQFIKSLLNDFPKNGTR